MKFINRYQTDAQFQAAYNGDTYIEPWASLTKENDEVNYNKRQFSGWFRVGKYDSNFNQGQYLTQEELDVYTNFFEAFKVEGFDPETATTGTTYTVRVNPETTIYRVGGVVAGFDPEDNTTWWEKDTNFRNVTFYYGDNYYQGMTGTFFFDMDWEGGNWNQGESGTDNMMVSIEYDFVNNRMISIAYAGSEEYHRG